MKNLQSKGKIKSKKAISLIKKSHFPYHMLKYGKNILDIISADPYHFFLNIKGLKNYRRHLPLPLSLSLSLSMAATVTSQSSIIQSKPTFSSKTLQNPRPVSIAVPSTSLSRTSLKHTFFLSHSHVSYLKLIQRCDFWVQDCDLV